ncbi:hydroxyproline O-arabinosyltransferase 3 [Olea europaea subsp. europaea]|uniref:Hydroxyproline O-arabinosyltransferase 3 n=1 Tax=Olea europaea subsp. europaea TaxID=158383 RepID=A0A8S0TGY0_OLEEU|nr:hydroxyproline O-arabinosyltransferase 3 [Olea europaea subsp. europaea]
MDFLEKIAPTWMNVSLKMKNDPKTEYFWMDARNHILFKDFMLQPLSNVETRKKFILHFTYGSDYSMKVKSKGIT